MSDLVEAVRAEMDRERSRHRHAMERLDGIERQVLELVNGAERETDSDAEGGGMAAPSAKAPARHGESSAAIGERRRRDLLELLRRQGPMSQAELTKITGWPGSGLSHHLEVLASDGKVRPEGQRRGYGRPSKVWAATAEAAESPELAAGMATSEDPAAVEPDLAVPADEDLDDLVDDELDDDFEIPPVVAIDDYRPPKHFKLSEEDERILQALSGEPKTSTDLRDELYPGGTRKRIVARLSSLSRVGRIDMRGARGGETLWLRRPLPHERPDVAIRKVDRKGTVEARILTELCGGRVATTLTLEQLAVRLVLHPRIVAGGLESLIADGQVEKLPGGKYGTPIGAAA